MIAFLTQIQCWFLSLSNLLAIKLTCIVHKAKVKKDILNKVNKTEGPHLRYINDGGKAQLISGIDKKGRMSLQVKYINRPKKIRVFKPGEQPISFSVRLKKKIMPSPSCYREPARIFALSDVEGNFNTVIRLLKTHKVLNSDLHWFYGKGHLVIIGDIFDRGNHVTELLWLIYRLEDEAHTAGGCVHLLLGNHEMMVLSNNLRYAEPKYKTFDVLVRRQLKLKYGDLFGIDTELGRWLRSKNTVVKIGRTLFAHGGLSPKLVEQNLTLDIINTTLRQAIDKSKSIRGSMEKLMFSRNGPLWYRGYFMRKVKSPKITAHQLRDVLSHFNADRITVGHTMVDKPTVLYDGLVIAINVKHPADHLETGRVSWGLEMTDGDIQTVSFK